MIKVSVMYPNTPGARFDHAYYRDAPMPLVKARTGDSCKHYMVDKGLAGGRPGGPALYVAMCHLFCDSVEAFQAGFGPHVKEIMADTPNDTDLTPVMDCPFPTGSEPKMAGPARCDCWSRGAQ